MKFFRKEDCKIDWIKISREIFNFIRGMNLILIVFFNLNGIIIKIYEMKINDKVYNNVICGEVVEYLKGKGIVVKISDGSFIISFVKLENKK